MIGKNAEEVLNRAVRYAFERQHEYFTLEHVLLSLLEETEILEVIQALEGSYTKIKKELEEYLNKEVPQANREERMDDEESEEAEDGMVEHPVATLSIQRLIQRALFHVQSAGKDEIKPIDLMVALFQAKDSFALHVLSREKIERLDVLNYISHGVTKEGDGGVAAPEGGGEAGEAGARGDAAAEIRKSKTEEVLTNFAVNLNELARNGKIDPLVGRSQELERITQTLCRRRKNNPLLVGEAGVGKTAIVEGLALRIEEVKEGLEKKKSKSKPKDDLPDFLLESEIFSLDMGSLLAGTKFRGDFEQRLKRLLKALEEKKEQGVNPILFIDEIHTIIGAGAVSGGVMDAANLLKPFLSRGEIQCIGSTTYGEFRNVFEKDHALVRRFQKVEVSEPSHEQTLKILQGLKPKFEKHHGIVYSTEALDSAIDLSVKHINDRFLPDKAIDVLDEVGARVRLAMFKDSSRSNKITSEDVEELIARIARIPARTVSTNQKSRLKSLERDLRLTIFGQDHAIDALVTSIQLARSGLRTGERPVGSFLFCGPTGVGKTELSKQLAHCLGIPFLRFDMSEYMEKHTVSRLIGAPPGYVGFEQAGLLTDQVLKNPHSVILLDEVEKAHADLTNILLQVMDHGFLTDNNGRKADFRNTILIMTSNVGTREHERRPMGFNADDRRAKSVSEKEVERQFSPEFRNRLDSIVYFNSLDPVTIAQVVGKQLLELEAQLLKKEVEIEVKADVREWLAQEGYDPKMGARPMARLIQDRIKKPLSEAILFGELQGGGRVSVSMPKGKWTKDTQVSFQYSKKKAKKKSTSKQTAGTAPKRKN